MIRLSLGRGVFDVFTVSEFGEAAYNGDLKRMESLLEKNPENAIYGMAYYLALRAGRKDVFQFLLDKKVPYPKSLYSYAMFENRDILSLLPYDEEQHRIAGARQPTFQLVHGLIHGTLSHHDVRDLIFAGADARNPVLVPEADNDYFPVHIAAMRPDFKVMKELVRAGVEPKMIGPDGKNAVRMIYESRLIGRKERKEFVKYFGNLNKDPLPALTFGEKLLLRFGLPLPPRTLPPGTSSSESHNS